MEAQESEDGEVMGSGQLGGQVKLEGRKGREEPRK